MINSRAIWHLHWLGKIATFRCKLPSSHAKTPSKHRQKNTKPECDFSSEVSQCKCRDFSSRDFRYFRIAIRALFQIVYDPQHNVYTTTCTRTHTHTHTHTQTHRYTQTHTHTHARTRTYTDTHKHTHARTRTHMYAHTHNARTHIHRYTHTHTHTHTVVSTPIEDYYI